jgi:hypothetical protein
MNKLTLQKKANILKLVLIVVWSCFMYHLIKSTL